MRKFTLVIAIGAALLVQSATAQNATSFTPEQLHRRTVERRAVDAVIWGLPLVGEDAVKQAAFRDGKATYNDIVWWPKGGGWKNQSPTPNVNTRYIYFFCNTKQDGPVVVELPPAVPGASFYGTIEDAWYVPLVDIGFEGKGGKYLVLPPDYKGDVPAGYTVVRPKTYNTMTLLRSILASMSEADVSAGNALVQKVKVYPLSKVANPPTQRLLDMTDVMYNGLVPYDESFFISLARMLNEETVQPADLQMMGMLLPLGIEKGKDFKPDAATVALLKETAAEAHAWLMDKAATDTTPWWPGSRWVVPSPPITMPTAFHWEVPNYFDVDSRAIALSQYFCPTAKLGTGSFYFGAFHDHSGSPLQGANNYRLHVPANVPVREFWSVTVYSLETSSFFLNAPNLTLGSLDKSLTKNADGSVDIYFGPKPPAGKESNWLYTQAGQKWFPWFRVYGPEKAILDKSWKLPDIERVDAITQDESAPAGRTMQVATGEKPAAPEPSAPAAQLKLVSTEAQPAAPEPSDTAEPAKPAATEDKPAAPESDENRTAALAKAAQNPVANLISFPLQNNTAFGIGPYSRAQNVLNIQPVIPFHITEKWNLITRTILPVVWQPNDEPRQGWFGFGDLNPSLFLSPAKPGKLIWGVGPAFVLPTATAEQLGQGKFSLGPSVVGLTTPGHWVIGALVNNVWSVAGPHERAVVNQMLLQWFVNYNMKKGWYFTTSPIVTANWRASGGNQWVVPLGGGVGRIMKLGFQPVNITGQFYGNVVHPEGASPWGMRLQIQFLFLQFTKAQEKEMIEEKLKQLDQQSTTPSK